MENPKKILIFSTAYYPMVGGAEVAIKEITDRIPDIQFDLITAKMKKGLPFREKIGNVTVYRLGIGNQFLDKFIVAFEGWFFANHLEKKKKYDAYWCMMVSFASGSAYIKNILSKEKTPIILTLQEGDSEKHLKTRWFGILDLSWRLALKRTQIITVISNYLEGRARRLGFKGKAELVPNGVDIEKFTKEVSEEDRFILREGFGIYKDDIVVVTASRLTKKNGIGDVIKALPRLSNKIKFLVLGDGELNHELHELAKKLHVDDQVVWKGYVSHHELPKYLKISDIFIRPSLSEGMGNSFVEAMVAGLPTIGTKVGGIVDFLEDGKTGYICEPENPKSITETILRVISDPNKETIVENGKKLVIEKYDWAKITPNMKAIFDLI